jgi:GDPmannose 4,6-dehydratase
VRSLIIGCAGQDGYFLSQELINLQSFVIGSKRSKSIIPKNHPLYNLGLIADIESENHIQLANLVIENRIDKVFYLSGLTSIAESQKNPELAFSINCTSYKNLLKELSTRGFSGQVIYASSTEIFNNFEATLNENSLRKPINIYGQTKLCAMELDFKGSNFPFTISNAIMSNHESFLRTEKFVTGKIALKLAAIKRGEIDKIQLGNIDIKKDWTSAAEIIKALILIAEGGYPGDFLLASGKLTSLVDLIEFGFQIIGIKNWNDYVHISDELIRKTDRIEQVLDISKAKKVLGWEPKISYQEWFAEMINYNLTKFK